MSPILQVRKQGGESCSFRKCARFWEIRPSLSHSLITYHIWEIIWFSAWSQGSLGSLVDGLCVWFRPG